MEVFIPIKREQLTLSQAEHERCELSREQLESEDVRGLERMLLSVVDMIGQIAIRDFLIRSGIGNLGLDIYDSSVGYIVYEVAELTGTTDQDIANIPYWYFYFNKNNWEIYGIPSSVEPVSWKYYSRSKPYSEPNIWQPVDPPITFDPNSEPYREHVATLYLCLEYLNRKRPVGGALG